MTRTFCVAAALLACSVNAAHGRPVSYQGGWTAIEQTDRQSSAVWIHYTLNPRLSLGYRGEWDRGQDYVFQGAQATALAKRWFGENYQANLYGFAGAGVAYGVDDNAAGARPAAFVGVLADWETRRWFLSYKARAIEAGEVDASAAQAARIGYAPYEGDTGDLHTWAMIEIDHRADNPEPVGVTPLVRLFKGPMLLEAGWSVLDDEPLFNFTYRF
ncbi:MAG: hypothetical protein AAFR11_02335 [Pseudomonadota bacterium]